MIASAEEARIHLHREMVHKGGLREFIRLAWHCVESRPLIGNWHIDAIADHLEAMSKVQIRNLIVNVPPGCGKSKIVSVLWPAWEWIERSGTRWIYASYDQALSFRDAEASLELITSPWYEARWGVVADPNQKILDYENKKGGWRYGTSVRGKVTGRHADIRVFDDPIKPLEATKKGLEQCIAWWNGTMSTRVADAATSRYAGIMQRIHENDLSGHLIDKGDVEVLSLPMEFETRKPCATSIGFRDPRTVEGELLFPARFPAAEVAKMTDTLGPLNASAQLQQNPTPSSGGIFEKGWMQQWFFLPPVIDQWFSSWDMTFKDEETSDFVCGGVWARAGLDYYLVWVLNKRLSFPASLAQMVRTATEYPQATTKLVEDKANGTAVVSMLQKDIQGLELVEPEGGKVARANAVSFLFSNHRVWLPGNADCYAGTSYIDTVKQLVGFPKATNDDIVDMISQGLNWGHKNHSNLEAAMAAWKKRAGL